MYPISSWSSRGLFLFLPGKGEGQRGVGTFADLRSFCKNLPPKKKQQKKQKQKKKQLHNIVEFNIDFDYTYHIPRGRGHSDFYVRPATLKTTLSAPCLSVNL